MEAVQMQRAWVEFSSSFGWMKGFLDAKFQQLQLLQDESSPDFVAEQIIDFKKVVAHVHQLKGCSSSIGAQRVKNDCIAFRSFCEEQNIEGHVHFVNDTFHLKHLKA